MRCHVNPATHKQGFSFIWAYVRTNTPSYPTTSQKTSPEAPGGQLMRSPEGGHLAGFPLLSGHFEPISWICSQQRVVHPLREAVNTERRAGGLNTRAKVVHLKVTLSCSISVAKECFMDFMENNSELEKRLRKSFVYKKKKRYVIMNSRRDLLYL